MSLFTAYRACGLCRKYHRLATDLNDDPDSAPLKSTYLVLRDQSNLTTLSSLDAAGRVDERLPVTDALSTCLGCDYSSAAVAEGLQGYIDRKLGKR